MTSRISPQTHERIAQAWPTILEGLARGDLVRDTLARVNISGDMLRAYKSSNAQARTEWDEARELSADAFLDAALETANNREEDPAHARVKIDTLKWAARIRNPRLYGDRATVDVNVRTVDLTRIILDANARLAAAQAPRLVQGETLTQLPSLESLDDVL